MTHAKICLMLAASALSACATNGYGYSYQTNERIGCATNLAMAGYVLDYADDVERQTGQDVDAYGSAAKFALWSNVFLAGFNALSAGRSPNVDDACWVVNDTADFVHDEY